MAFIQLTKEQAKEELRKLIKDFEDYIKEVDKLSETSIRTSYIDRLFEILGWNIRNPKQTVLEPQDKEGRLDYLLKLGNIDTLIIEAKKTKINLDIDSNSGISSSKQAIMYAWHKNCKFAILTNFKELKVFHALFKPRNINRHLVYVQDFGYFNLKYTNLLEKFDLLWLLSKESFLKGELKKYLSKDDIKISKPVDETILEDLFQYRKWLSQDIKDLNLYITKNYGSNREEFEIIDEVIQQLIDRLIFIRSTEDRGLEEEDKLLKLVKNFKEMRLEKRLFFELIDVFEKFNTDYNSKLFEKSFIDTKLKISDEILIKVITGLYFGTDNHTEKYNFNIISVDLLGSIYEQYLGVILRITELRAKLKESNYRKEMGIYYTPSYIVEYIVENTIGKLVKDKNIDELSQLKILDPACGSGSFLQSAFSFMANEMKERIKEGEKSRDLKVFNLELKENKLWLGQKVQTLKNNIFGVDLDEKAVGIAQLSLLLKLLEGEGTDTKKRLLPIMTDNIKCGNSLIDDSSFDKSFNWKANFKNIFKGSDNDGFDVVIGNPPYVDYREIKGTKFFKEHYESAKVKEKYNLLILFIERGLQLLKDGGILGFIVSNQFLCSDFGLKLREYILENSEINQIIDVSHIRVFKDASTYPVIIILEKIKPKANTKVKLASVNNELNIAQNSFEYHEIKQDLFKKTDNNLFIVDLNENTLGIIEKLKKDTKLLKEYVKEITWGTSATGYGKKKIKEGEFIKLTNKDKEKYAKIIQTSDIERYGIDWQKEYIPQNLYTENKLKFFEENKIVIGRLNKFLKASLDTNKYSLGKATLILCEDDNKLKFLLAILNSKLIDYYFKLLFQSTHMSQGYIRYDIPYLEQLPIKISNKKQEEQIIKKVDRMLELNEKYLELKEGSRAKDSLKQQIDQTDYEINELIYDLYDLTKEEINIIKKSS